MTRWKLLCSTLNHSNAFPDILQFLKKQVSDKMWPEKNGRAKSSKKRARVPGEAKQVYIAFLACKEVQTPDFIRFLPSEKNGEFIAAIVREAKQSQDGCRRCSPMPHSRCPCRFFGLFFRVFIVPQNAKN